MDAVTREEVRDLRSQLDSLKRDFAGVTRQAKNRIMAHSREWADHSRDWVKGHPKASVGVLSGVAIGIGFGLGFWLGHRSR